MVALVRSPYLRLILFLFGCVYLVNLDSLRLTRDDWANMAEMARRLHDHGALSAIQSIVTNDWLSPDTPRIFFGAWLVQFLVGYLGRYNYVSYYLFILTAHLGVTYLLWRIFLRVLGSAWLAAVLASSFLVLPPVTKVLYWLNNWFFAIPLDLLILQIYLLVFPRRSRYVQTALLFLVTAFGQLCGEQTILMFYWSLVLGVSWALRATSGRERTNALVACSLALLGSATVMFFYVTRIMKFSALHTPVAASLERTHEYVSAYGRLLARTFEPASFVFGSWTVPLSAKSATLMAVCVLAIAVTFWRAGSREPLVSNSRSLGYTILALSGYVVLALGPLLYGAYTGARPGPTTSYILCAAAPLSLLVVCAVVLLVRECLRPWEPLLRVVLLAFVAYCACLTIYSTNEVWGFQKAIDNDIWRRIDDVITDRVDFIVTDNLSERQGQLMAHWDSDAVSDFQADWGVFGRLFATYGRGFRVGRDVERLPHTSELRLLDYYGGSSTIRSGERGIFLAYRYGPTFYSLKSAQLFVFTRLEDFEAFKRRNGSN